MEFVDGGEDIGTVSLSMAADSEIVLTPCAIIEYWEAFRLWLEFEQ